MGLPQCVTLTHGEALPMLLIDIILNRITLDIVRPLPWSTRGYRYLLVIMDYATRYPKAVPLKGMQVAGMTQALLQFVSRVGLPREILTDKGATFTLSLLKQLCQALGIH